MAATTEALAAAVDALVQQDLSELDLAGLQEQYADLAPQVQRLMGLGAAVLAELHTRTHGVLPTDIAGALGQLGIGSGGASAEPTTPAAPRAPRRAAP